MPDTQDAASRNGAQGPNPGTLAAIDAGTNTTRLLIVGPDGRDIRRLTRFTRLGEAVDATGQLAPEAVERTLVVLREYRGELDAAGGGRLRATATSAARDAANAEDLFVPAQEILGVPLEVIAGQEEGRLSFAGATAGLSGVSGPCLVVDIGGGSTELVVGRLGASVGVVSLALGSTRLTERHLAHDPPHPGELAAAQADAAARLREASASLPDARSAELVVGVAGTVTTIAGLDLGLTTHEPDLVHHHLLSADAAQRWRDTLAREDRETRLGHTVIPPGRVDVIVAGAIILAEVLAWAGAAQCLVSETDILDGLISSLGPPDGGRGR